MQEYADYQYAVEFNDAKEYEDNILIVFLIDEERQGYYTIAYVGDNIEDDINLMFGNEYTAFGRVMKGNIARYYENVSTKVVKIIQSYTGVVNKMVWRKF